MARFYWEIWWKPSEGEAEYVDEADTKEEAERLVKEYIMAFHDGHVWKKRRRNDDDKGADN